MTGNDEERPFSRDERRWVYASSKRENNYFGFCRTGTTTHKRWLMRGLDPTLKSLRLANYIVSLRKDLLAISCACGVLHPAEIEAEQLELLDGQFGSQTISDIFGHRVAARSLSC